MLKKAALILVLIAVAAIVLVFSHLNKGAVTVDLAFAEVTRSTSLLFVVTLLIGWLLGVASMSLFTLRLVNERRTLRRSLRISESEVSSLRNLPLSDAD